MYKLAFNVASKLARMLFLLVLSFIIGGVAKEVHLTAKAELVDNSYQWTLYNSNLGTTPVSFHLCFPLKCNNTLPEGMMSARGKLIGDDAIFDYVQTPKNSFGVKFNLGETTSNPTLSLAQFDNEYVGFCKERVYVNEIMPAFCRLRGQSSAICSGSELICRHVGKTKNGKIVPAVFDATRNVMCSAEGFSLQTESGDVPLCADKLAEDLYVFNTLVNQKMAIQYTGFVQTVFVDLETHDTVEGTVFVVILVLCLVVWTGATKGGQTLERTSVRPPTKRQKLLIGEVSFSIFTTVCYSLHDHGLSLLPPSLSHSVGDEYGAVIIVLYLLLQTALTAIISALLFTSLTANDYEKLLLLRGLVEIQLLVSIHLHFPLAFGVMLRELVGLFIAVTTLVICGRDASIFFKDRPLLMWHVMIFCTFLLALHHVVVVGLYDILLASSHMSDESVELMAVALSLVLLGVGSTLK